MQQRTIFREELNGRRLDRVYGELVRYLMFLFYFVVVVCCCFWTEYCDVIMICTRMLSSLQINGYHHLQHVRKSCENRRCNASHVPISKLLKQRRRGGLRERERERETETETC